MREKGNRRKRRVVLLLCLFFFESWCLIVCDGYQDVLEEADPLLKLAMVTKKGAQTEQDRR